MAIWKRKRINIMNNNDYLMHYGIKGQKWGIRRYQNYDGTYTQRGVQRYKKAVENFNEKKSAYDKAKESKDPSKIASAKSEMQTAKMEGDRIYKKLKYDKRADQGKELYKRGVRISSAGKAAGVAGSAASILGAVTVASLKYDTNLTPNVNLGKLGTYKASTLISGVGTLGAAATAGVLGLREMDVRKKMSAYYAH
jgi:hypothetical protein